TISGAGKMVNIIVLANSDAYQADISEFLGSVNLPKIDPRPETSTSPGAGDPQSGSARRAKDEGYAFNTTNWDDGWTSVVQDDWVLVHKGQTRVYLLYALPYNAPQFSGTGVRARDFYWDTYVSKYFAIQSKQYRDESSIGSFNAEYVEGWATERQTGDKRFVAMYLNIAPNTAFLKIASAPDENTLRQQFPNSHKIDQSDLSAMDRYNQFPVSASDIVGNWTDGDTSTAHWYYVSPAGYETYAGMTIASTSAAFNFAKGGNYTSQHRGTTGSVGNLNSFKQSYKGTYKVSNWSVSATNRWQGKTDEFKAYFKVVRGGRILVLDSGGATYNLVRAK
ncbi:MAG: hypothetical protein J5I65_05520, partial [Aridibacter famidurans]|nr:hypothetical protein [Aridibacter famidurans]